MNVFFRLTRRNGLFTFAILACLQIFGAVRSVLRASRNDEVKPKAVDDHNGLTDSDNPVTIVRGNSVHDFQDEHHLLHDDDAVYFKEAFVARGGQAEVWTGVDLLTQEKVVLRFPIGMCEHKYCRMFELSPETVAEFQMACDMASIAERRYQERQAALDLSSESRPGFSECVRHLPTSSDALAFEVWKYVGEVTLAVALFMGSFTIGGKRTTLDFDNKIRILRRLKDQVGALTSYSEVGSGLCCCLSTSPYQCSKSVPYSSLDALSLRETRGLCPDGYEENYVRCGPIVHHDLKFDNVVLNVDEELAQSAKDAFAPVVIDFGASTFCWGKSASAAGYSVDWVPPWLENKFSYDRWLCQSYDTYGVGLMHLVVELLRDLPPYQLLCDTSSEPRAQNTSECNLDPSSVGQTMLDEALLPINMLVHDLRQRVLTPAVLSRPDSFVNALQHFVSTPSIWSSAVQRLPLVMPATIVLKEDIFPMLRECPNFLVEDYADRLLSCKSNVLRRRMNDVESGKFNFLESVEYQELCGESPAVGNIYFKKDICVGSETLNFWRLVDAQDAHGLQVALKEVYFESQGAICKRKLPNEGTMLTLVARKCNTVLLSVLLDHCGTFYAKYAVIPAAETFGCSETLEFLYEHKSVMNASEHKYSRFQARVIGAAAVSGDVNVMDFALEVCEKLGVGDSFSDALSGRNNCCDLDDIPVIRAARAGPAAVVQRLLQARADVKVVDSKGVSPLGRAVLSGHAESVRILGAQDPSMVHTRVLEAFTSTLKSGRSSLKSLLHIATLADNEGVVKALLDLRADPSLIDDEAKTTPLQVACLQEPVSLPIVRLLRTHSNDLRVFTASGQFLLSEVAERGQVDVLHILIKDAPDEALLVRDSDGGHALAAAAGAGKLDCVRALFDRIPAPGSWSILTSPFDPVALAVARAQHQSVSLLLQLGFTLPVAWGYERIPIAMLVGWGDGPHHRRDQRCATLQLVLNHYGHEALSARDVLGVNALGRWAFDGDIQMIRCLDIVLNVSICTDAAVTFRDALSLPAATPSASVNENRQHKSHLTALGVVRARLRADKDDKNLVAVLGGLSWGTSTDDQAYDHTYQGMGRGMGRAGQEAVLDYLIKRGCNLEHALPWHEFRDRKWQLK